MRVSARERPAYTESTTAQNAMAAQLALEMEAETEAAGGAFHECSSSARLVRCETPACADAESAPPEAEAFFSATQLTLDADGAEDKAIVVEAAADDEDTDTTSTMEQDTNVDQDAELPPPGRKLSAEARAGSGSLVLERIRNEGLLALLLQVGPPFLLAGLGLVATGAVLHTMIESSAAFKQIRALNVVIPPLIGLKGDLEMTLAARLSTLANLNRLNTWEAVLRHAASNLVLVVGQALWLGGLSGVIGALLETVGRSKDNWPFEVVTLLATVLLTAAIASLLLGLLMVAVVVACSRLRINPDNVTSPLAASLGDVTTVALLALFGNALYEHFYVTGQWWFPVLVVLVALTVAATCLVSSCRNSKTAALARTGWIPICSSVAFSSVAGWIFDRTLHYRDMTILMPVVNGVSGDLAGIAVSKLSTELHADRRHRVNTSKHETAATKGHPLQTAQAVGSVISVLSVADEAYHQSCFGELENPVATFCTFSSNQSRRSAALLGISVPGHVLFVGTIYLLGYSRDTIGLPAFFPAYLLSVFLQVGLLIYVSLWIARFMWRRGNDPDSYAIPYVTGLGDVSGTSALALTFCVLALLYPNAGFAQPPANAGATALPLLAGANVTHALNTTLLSF